MNLDNLKDLEAKATPGKWFPHEHPSELYWNISRRGTSNRGESRVAGDVDATDAELLCILRNSAKEMIETMERYQRVLERIRDRELLKAAPEIFDSSDPLDKGLVAGLIMASDMAANALIGPEKTARILKS